MFLVFAPERHGSSVALPPTRVRWALETSYPRMNTHGPMAPHVRVFARCIVRHFSTCDIVGHTVGSSNPLAYHIRLPSRILLSRRPCMLHITSYPLLSLQCSHPKARGFITVSPHKPPCISTIPITISPQSMSQLAGPGLLCRCATGPTAGCRQLSVSNFGLDLVWTAKAGSLSLAHSQG